MSPRGSEFRTLAAAGLVGVLAIPIATSAAREERSRREAFTRLARAMQPMVSLAKYAGTGKRVHLNGEPVVFDASVVKGTVGDALDAIERACASSNARTALAAPAAVDEGRTPGPALHLVRVDRQATEGAAAALCVLEDAHDTRYVRYAFARPVEGEDGVTSVISIATESGPPIESMFPAEGDVPGGDLPGIPRPRGARRAFAASIETDGYGVRVYETQGPLGEVVAAYDADMANAGCRRSAAVAAALPDARIYSCGDRDLVASFKTGDSVTLVSLATLDPT